MGGVVQFPPRGRPSEPRPPEAVVPAVRSPPEQLLANPLTLGQRLVDQLNYNVANNVPTS
jgi:hypothetical protein